jgi:predicted O-methyltransferase YrrM
MKPSYDRAVGGSDVARRSVVRLEESARKLKRTGRTLQARGELQRLEREGGPTGRAVAAALRAALAGRATPDEREAVGAIEAVRSHLEASDVELTFPDFGRGSTVLDADAHGGGSGSTTTRSVGQICKATSKPPRWAFLLFQLVRHLQPSRCLELGTSVGISAAYQAAALGLNGRGTLVTLEGAEPVAAQAVDSLDRLGLADHARVVVGRFQDTLPEVLAELEPVDYAFIDGHHDRDATERYFGDIAPHAAENAVLVLDDIAWSTGMKEAWDAVRRDERVTAAVDLGGLGLCTLGRSRTGPPAQFTVRFD